VIWGEGHIIIELSVANYRALLLLSIIKLRGHDGYNNEKAQIFGAVVNMKHIDIQ
jgi:hypothetical protein